jgi:DNA repair exonuclease SbcCD ATPase subunit
MNELMANVNKSLTSRSPNLIAAEINNIKEQTRKMVLYNSIEIGRRLIEAKELVPHGEWGEWLEKSVEYSKSTANNLMRIFNEYGSSQLTLLDNNAKSQALGDLSYTQAVAMLSVPSEERESFIKDNDIESMSTRELQKAIKEKEEALKLAKEKSEEAIKNLNEKHNVESKLRTVDEVLRDTQNKYDSIEKALRLEKEKSEKVMSSLDKTIAENKRLISEAQAAGNDEEVKRLQASLQEIQEDLDSSALRIDELEAQLKAKPIDVITAEPVVVEKIPDEVVQELQELREKANQNTGADKSTVKFSLQFDGLVKNFKDILGTLEEIQSIEVKEKYKAAVKGLANKMVERL